jgi:hypothetical protein
VLLSAVPKSVREARETDLELFRLARNTFDERNVEVLDWILTGGDDIRSLASRSGAARARPARLTAAPGPGAQAGYGMVRPASLRALHSGQTG